MSIRQITIVGTGLIGGSLGLALKEHGFAGRIVGSDRAPVLTRARAKGAIDEGMVNPHDAIRGSQVVVLATPVGAIIDLISELGPALPKGSLLTDVGDTKVQVLSCAQSVFGDRTRVCFLGGHPMAAREPAGVDFADAKLFRDSAWFLTPSTAQKIHEGIAGEYVEWIEKIGARIAVIEAAEHDELCAWISQVPQLLATALAAGLIQEYGPDAPLLDVGGSALRDIARIARSPYAIWRDIAITNKSNIEACLLKIEQRLAHIRENLASRELAAEFELAHQIKKTGNLNPYPIKKTGS